MAKVKVQIDTNKIARRVQNNSKFWLFASSEWKRLITPFTPFETGALSENVTVEPKRLTYNELYARRLYYGTHFNFRKDKHSKASAKWDKSAMPTQKPKLIRILQRYIEKVDI